VKLRRRAISVACAVALLALPVSAFADAPAKDEYTPPPLSATGHGGGNATSGDRNGDPKAVTAAGSSSSGSAIPILFGGLGAATAAGAVIYMRRRNADRDLT